MKIGIIRYPYFRQVLKGGDYILFDSIIESLEQEHSITLVEFRRPFGWLVGMAPLFLVKIVMRFVDLVLPFLYAWQLRSMLDKFDLVIADSAAVTRVPFCKDASKKILLLINIDYSAYLKAIAGFLPLHSRIIMRWKSWLQDSGMAVYQSVAVSRFVAQTVGARSLRIPQTIENRIRGVVDIPARDGPRQGMVYAGSGDFFGKGLDVLESLASRGMKIHTYSPAVVPGCLNHGPVPRDKLLAALPAHDVMIFPSRYESFGLVVIEAMASGVPVVMRNTGVGIELAKIIPQCVVPADATTVEWESALQNVSANRAQVAEECRAFARNYVEQSTFSESWREKVIIFHDSAH